MIYTITISDEAGVTSAEIKVSPEIVIALLIEANKQSAPTPPLVETKTKAKTYHSKKVEKEDQPAVKKQLTETQRETIREMLKAGTSVKEICDDMGVSNPTVYLIRSKMKSDGDLPDEE